MNELYHMKDMHPYVNNETYNTNNEAYNIIRLSIRDPKVPKFPCG